MEAISRLTSSIASGGRRLRICAASSWGRVSRRIADFLTPERSAMDRVSGFGARVSGERQRWRLYPIPEPRHPIPDLAPIQPPLDHIRRRVGILFDQRGNLF